MQVGIQYKASVKYHRFVTIHIETPPDFSFLECINSHGWR